MAEYNYIKKRYEEYPKDKKGRIDTTRPKDVKGSSTDKSIRRHEDKKRNMAYKMSAPKGYQRHTDIFIGDKKVGSTPRQAPIHKK